MNLSQLALDNGYALLALGLLLEGETAVLLGTLAAHRGWLRLPVVFGMAFGIAWTLDQAMFWVGRWKGASVLASRRRLARAAVRARRWVRRYPHACVLGIRFAYGLRTAGPILIGATGLPPLQFALLSAVGALVWAALLCTAGWMFSHALERLLAHPGGVQMALLALLLGVILVVWLVRRRRQALAAASAQREA